MEEQQTIQKKRCNLERCNKKLTLMDQELKCRCGYIYCPLHRLPESHTCSFDFITNEKIRLEKTLSQMRCVGSKVTKI